ncbi:hypothetical protein ADUPG1_007725 [Aduncisulcus paluster]|uniref:Uncharacterized protein n=1 Tax=Aduncisulcus paluster TaxID=2918883 RepID=A0ABQ5KPA8_9EUKA|nr:hypothetical protein ADUPG1_007725 [Aduncisulcus paluster]|eukprot:gnl/Carplike_NY0171/3624_a4898_331.p1 GENE.gnl/Carplike_NY0171/3624_a4898_331~~gnl/Carplike_NY0171/3624_a4898_331.p1  ORF type:complete len:331 (+),score=46.71 gnl/Carplike_NY0171/3624_a4898_331:89-1081(+)
MLVSPIVARLREKGPKTFKCLKMNMYGKKQPRQLVLSSDLIKNCKTNFFSSELVPTKSFPYSDVFRVQELVSPKGLICYLRSDHPFMYISDDASEIVYIIAELANIQLSLPIKCPIGPPPIVPVPGIVPRFQLTKSIIIQDRYRKLIEDYPYGLIKCAGYSWVWNVSFETLRCINENPSSSSDGTSPNSARISTVPSGLDKFESTSVDDKSSSAGILSLPVGHLKCTHSSLTIPPFKAVIHEDGNISFEMRDSKNRCICEVYFDEIAGKATFSTHSRAFSHGKRKFSIDKLPGHAYSFGSFGPYPTYDVPSVEGTPHPLSVIVAAYYPKL